MYLPLLTAAPTAQTQKIYILKMAYIVLVSTTTICYVMVLFKESLIHLLYSPKFDEAGDLLAILVIAVIFRGISWVYGMLIVASKSSRVLIISDVALNVGLIILTRFSLQHFSSLASLGWAFVIVNFLYLVFVVEYVHFKNRLILRRYIWPLLTASVLPLLVMAMYSDKYIIQWKSSVELFLAIEIVVIVISLCSYRRVNT